ncbi:MAG: ABC transporter ATP-binding protein [Pseudomonadota bacterium]
MIEVEGLTKRYGRFTAIKDVNFHIKSGEIVGFLGPNGAGKTTTMRILTCFSPPTAGTARVGGMDVLADSLKIRRQIGYLPENVPIYDWMRVRSYLGFVARAKGVKSSERNAEVARVTKAVGIDEVVGKIIRNLSKGYKQRVGLAQALIGDPPILVLDEPTIGLDPRQIREIRRLIKSFARNRTVILSTHILPEVSQVCDRVIIINKGTIVAEDTPSNLTLQHGKSGRIRVAVRAPEDQAAAFLKGMKGILSVESLGIPADGEVKFMVKAESRLDVRSTVSRAVVERGWDLLELTPVDVSLEDVFIGLTTEESDDVASSDLEETRESAS